MNAKVIILVVVFYSTSECRAMNSPHDFIKKDTVEALQAIQQDLEKCLKMTKDVMQAEQNGTLTWQQVYSFGTTVVPTIKQSEARLALLAKSAARTAGNIQINNQDDNTQK